MRLMLDSHVLLWWMETTGVPLSHRVKGVVDASDGVFVSAASVWELEIKRQAGRLELGSFTWPMLDERATEILPIGRDDALAAAALPLIHRDPFDRMIVAQAMRRELTLVTRDRALSRYGVPIIEA